MPTPTFIPERHPRIGAWLGRGWNDFLLTRWISMAFSAIFVFIGLLLAWLLMQRNLGLVLFPLLSGFVVVAPVLVTGYQRVARLLRHGVKPGFNDLLLGIREATSGIWFLTFVLCLCYMIWVTDALVIYGIYFGIEGTPLEFSLLSDTALRAQLFGFLLYSGLLGLLIALIGFVVAAFSIPLIMHRRLPFAAAVNLGVLTVLKNPGLMARWALLLAGIMLLTLVIALPLLIVVLPTLAYASHAAYLDLLGTDEDGPPVPTTIMSRHEET